MAKQTRYKFAGLLLTLLFFGATAGAQYSFNDVENITATVQPVVNLTLVKNNTSALNFTSSTAYINGITSNNFVTCKVKSNVSWLVTVSSTTAFFSASGNSASANMPANVLSFTVGSSTTSYPLSTAGVRVASGTRGNEASTGNTFNLNLTAKPNYDYGPGIYTITINYTLTAQ